MCVNQALLEADPFDPDVQMRIEELIQKQNIEENLAAVCVTTVASCSCTGGIWVMLVLVSSRRNTSICLLILMYKHGDLQG
jgi:hypothetical protein